MDKIFIADIKCEAYWKSRITTYIDFTELYIGKVRIASFYYDVTRQKEDDKKYKVTSELPNIKKVIGWFKTEEGAKNICIEVAKVFCRQLTEVIPNKQ